MPRRESPSNRFFEFARAYFAPAACLVLWLGVCAAAWVSLGGSEPQRSLENSPPATVAQNRPQQSEPNPAGQSSAAQPDKSAPENQNRANTEPNRSANGQESAANEDLETLKPYAVPPFVPRDQRIAENSAEEGGTSSQPDEETSEVLADKPEQDTTDAAQPPATANSESSVAAMDPAQVQPGSDEPNSPGQSTASKPDKDDRDNTSPEASLNPDAAVGHGDDDSPKPDIAPPEQTEQTEQTAAERIVKADETQSQAVEGTTEPSGAPPEKTEPPGGGNDETSQPDSASPAAPVKEKSAAGGNLEKDDSGSPQNAVTVKTDDPSDNKPEPAATAPAERPASETPDSPAGSAHIARAQLTSGIENREPTDRVIEAFYTENQPLRRLYYFTEIKDLRGETVTHNWWHEDRLIAQVEFDIGGNSWRVYSSKRLTTGMIGPWRVVVTDSQGNTLSVARFEYKPS